MSRTATPAKSIPPGKARAAKKAFITQARQNAPGAIPMNAAIAQISVEYAAKLEKLQAGSYDDIVIDGQSPDWREVITMFACKTAGAEDGVDVAAMDADCMDWLRGVFWDMAGITTEVETVKREDSMEKVLHIITAKTADGMRTAYAFSKTTCWMRSWKSWAHSAACWVI